MKKLALSLGLFMLLACPLAASAAESASDVKSGPAGNPVELLTGKIWQESSPETKQAWLFGVDSAVAVEHAVIERMRENAKNKKNAIQPSPFVMNWMKAFGSNDTRADIVRQINEWYSAHPDQLDRPVMDVIWYEIIVPRTSGK